MPRNSRHSHHHRSYVIEHMRQPPAKPGAHVIGTGSRWANWLMHKPTCTTVVLFASKAAAVSLRGGRVGNVLVELVHAQALAHAAQLAHVLGHLLHRLHLLAQQLALHKVGHGRVAVLVRDLVQLAQLLEVELLQRQRHLHGVQRVALVGVVEIDVGHHDRLQLDAPAALVLVRHEQLGVLALLVAGRLEVLGQAGQTHVVAVKVRVHRVVDVGHVVLNVDLLVDCSLALGVVAHTRKGGLGHVGPVDSRQLGGNLLKAGA
mmetsp:Transcript_13140/g.32143  ORF Transcript_13140/g.32143 Transcript_13140/m.32143 type:complete len:261 (-) Transcript_13140:175-957(-)